MMQKLRRMDARLEVDVTNGQPDINVLREMVERLVINLLSKDDTTCAGGGSNEYCITYNIRHYDVPEGTPIFNVDEAMDHLELTTPPMEIIRQVEIPTPVQSLSFWDFLAGRR